MRVRFRKISVKILFIREGDAEKVSGVTDRIRRYTTVTRVEYGSINGYNPKISGIPTDWVRGLLNSSRTMRNLALVARSYIMYIPLCSHA